MNPIISLTSFAKRLPFILPCLESLSTQTASINRIVLWLGDHEFPNGITDLPQPLQEFLLSHSPLFEVHFTTDIGPFTKLIPALRAFPNSPIITVDDDVRYHPDMVQRLLNARKRNPSAILAHAISDFFPLSNTSFRRTMGTHGFGSLHTPFPLRMMLGVSGVLYPPRAFSKQVFNIPLFQRLSPTNDDIWFWYCATRNNTPIIRIQNPIPDPSFIHLPSETPSLSNINEINQDETNLRYLANILAYDPTFAHTLTSFTQSHRILLFFLHLRRIFVYYPKRLLFCLRVGGLSFLHSELKRKFTPKFPHP